MNFDSWICVHLRLCACVLIIFVMVLLCFFVSVSPKCLKIRTQFAIYITHICHVEKLCIELVLFFCCPQPLLFIVFFFYIVWFIFPCIRQMAKNNEWESKAGLSPKTEFLLLLMRVCGTHAHSSKKSRQISILYALNISKLQCDSHPIEWKSNCTYFDFGISKRRHSHTRTYPPISSAKKLLKREFIKP